MTRLIMSYEEMIDDHVVIVHRVSEYPEMYAVHTWDGAIRSFVALVENAPTQDSAVETAREVLKDPLAYARCVLAEAVRIVKPHPWERPSDVRAQAEAGKGKFDA